jgi:hypothetical protein
MVVEPDGKDKITVPKDCPSCPVYIGPEGSGPSQPEPVGKDDPGANINIGKCSLLERLPVHNLFARSFA